MTAFDLLTFIALPDAFAGMGLLLAWTLSGLLIEHPPKARPSVTTLMADYRRAWMTQMITRQPRIFDAAILGSLRQGTTFFASSCLIAIGGMLALLGNAERLSVITETFAAAPVPLPFLQFKIMVVALLLVHGFLKFAWANRLFGYCAVVMSATPNDPGPKADLRAAQAAEINIRAAMNFNRGLRSVYFALTALAWLFGWMALALATLLTLWTILSREFLSHSRTELLRTDL